MPNACWPSLFRALLKIMLKQLNCFQEDKMETLDLMRGEMSDQDIVQGNAFNGPFKLDGILK